MDTTERTVNRRPSDRALRASGALYLLLVVTSIFGFFAPSALTVSGNATATAHNILASETLFRLALVSGLVATIAFIFLARALYRLFVDVNRSQATLMVILVLVSIPLSFLSTLAQVAALTVLHSGSALSAFDAGQVDALALLFLKLSSNVSAVNSIFFGLWLLPFAFLVIRSSFVPQIFGYLLIVAGISYLLGSLNFLLQPPFSNFIDGVVTVGYLGELAVAGWLVFQAVKVQLAGVRA